MEESKQRSIREKAPGLHVSRGKFSGVMWCTVRRGEEDRRTETLFATLLTGRAIMKPELMTLGGLAAAGIVGGIVGALIQRYYLQEKNVKRLPAMKQTSPKKLSRSLSSAPDEKNAVGFGRLVKSKSTQAQNVESLADIFSELAGEDNLLEFAEFNKALVERLQISLSEVEIERVWAKLVAERDTPLGEITFTDAKLTQEEFARGVQNVSLLRCCVRSLAKDANAFRVPASYDFTKSTNDNYAVPKAQAAFHGDFTSIREKLDYDYHAHYSKERQLWQDHAIKTVVSRTAPQGNPWVVYTCGPMGAGKGFVLGWMSRNGYFPLEE